MKIFGKSLKKVAKNYRLLSVLKLLDPDPGERIIYGSGSATLLETQIIS